MNTNPLVTIIVVSYNQAKYIKENLDSIKSQTYNNIELIVADDASPDNSVAIFESWLTDNNYSAKKNYHQNNTGLATILNECIEIATGKYIKIIAADDYLHPESIEQCVTKLEELGDDYGMIFSDTHAVNHASQITSDIANYNALGNIDPLLFRNELIKGNRIAALTVLMRLDVLKETGKYDSKLIVEDYYRWLKINEKYLITYIPTKLAYYRLHDNNITRVKADRIAQEDLILKMIFDKNGILKEHVNSSALKYYLTNKNLPKEFLKAYNNYPYKTKRLALAMQYKFPVFLYKILNNII